MPLQCSSAGFGAAAPSFRAAALAAFFLAAGPIGHADAEIVVPRETIRPGVVIEAAHLTTIRGQAGPGEFALTEDVIGLAPRLTLYSGRPIRMDDLGPPVVVERNSFVTLRFRRGGMTLSTEGRALDNGGIGERVRVMNLDSRRTVFGVIVAPGLVEVR